MLISSGLCILGFHFPRTITRPLFLPSGRMCVQDVPEESRLSRVKCICRSEIGDVVSREQSSSQRSEDELFLAKRERIAIASYLCCFSFFFLPFNGISVRSRILEWNTLNGNLKKKKKKKKTHGGVPFYLSSFARILSSQTILCPINVRFVRPSLVNRP